MRNGKDPRALQPVAFEPLNDLSPTPFDGAFHDLARQLKHSGLPWQPFTVC